jgi:hypothetical protein
MLCTEMFNIIFGVKFYIKTIIVSNGFTIKNESQLFIFQKYTTISLFSW